MDRLFLPVWKNGQDVSIRHGDMAITAYRTINLDIMAATGSGLRQSPGGGRGRSIAVFDFIPLVIRLQPFIAQQSIRDGALGRPTPDQPGPSSLPFHFKGRFGEGESGRRCGVRRQ